MTTKTTWAGALLLALGAFAGADEAHAAGDCGVGGTYLHTFSGTGYGKAAPAASGSWFVAAGQSTFDAGTLTWRDSSNFGGLPVLDRELVATYHFDAATCEGVVYVGAREIARLVAARGGDEILFVNTIPQTAVGGRFERVAAGSCDAGSFAGEYVTELSGATYRSAGTIDSNGPSRMVESIGRLVVDPVARAWTWARTVSAAGRVERHEQKGTFRLQPFACRVLAEATEECVDGRCTSLPPGGSTGRFAVAADGSRAVYVSTTPNATLAGRALRP